MELMTDESAHSSETTYDKMPRSLFDCLHRTPPCNYFFYFTLYEHTASGDEHVSDNSKAGEYEKDGKYSTDFPERMHLLIAYRSYRYDGHIQTVQKGPTLDNHVAQGSHYDDDDQADNGSHHKVFGHHVGAPVKLSVLRRKQRGLKKGQYQETGMFDE
jgi:hypothetical protein